MPGTSEFSLEVIFLTCRQPEHAFGLLAVKSEHLSECGVWLWLRNKRVSRVIEFQTRLS